MTVWIPSIKSSTQQEPVDTERFKLTPQNVTHFKYLNLSFLARPLNKTFSDQDIAFSEDKVTSGFLDDITIFLQLFVLQIFDLFKNCSRIRTFFSEKVLKPVKIF